jgi:RimJ/RimL family protein N-acetyltransferase
MLPIDPGSYPFVVPLFKEMENLQPVCRAVLEGLHPGKVFTDRADLPRSACLVTAITGEEATAWVYLAGDPGQVDFTAALKDGLLNRNTLGSKVRTVLITCSHADWHALVEDICDPLHFEIIQRRHYTCRRLDHPWRETLPEGFEILPFDEGLLHRKDTSPPDEVARIIQTWRRLRGKGVRDFGFTIIDNGRKPSPVVSWATVDFILLKRGDLAFFTDPRYRRRGLGTAVAAAALEHGLSIGLDEITWTCMEENIGSVFTVERLRLDRNADYQVHAVTLER